MSAAKGYFIAKARASWGEPPDWVAALAEACDRSSQTRVARDLGLNPGYLSWALARQRPRHHPPVEAAVRGRILDARVQCPVLGALRLDRCALLSAGRVRLSPAMSDRFAKACPACPHGGGGAAHPAQEKAEASIPGPEEQRP